MAKRVVTTDRLMAPIAHFSHGVRVGDRIHIGAEAGTDPAKRLAGASPGIPDMAAQAERLFDNFEIALAALGATLRDVVRWRAWLDDWRDLAAYQEVFRRRFVGRQPASATLGSWGFPLPHATVEAELLAVLDGNTRGQRWGSAAGVDADDALQRLASAVEPRDVVSINVSLADIRDAAALRAALARFFPARTPAHTIVGTSLADPAARVLVEYTAVPGGGEPLAGNAMLAGEELYIGGQSAVGPNAEAQTRGAWTRIQAILDAAGMTRADVVRTSNTLIDWRDYAGYNAGYGAFVEAPYPPRATMLGALAQPGARVQIEALAHRAGREALTLEANPPG